MATKFTKLTKLTKSIFVRFLVFLCFVSFLCFVVFVVLVRFALAGALLCIKGFGRSALGPRAAGHRA